MRPVAASAVALTVLLAWAAPLVAQDPPAPLTAQDKFKTARTYIADGKLDLAVVMLKSFLDTPPVDKDFLDLEARYGPTVFQKLLRVVQWSDNKEADAAAKKVVDDIIARSNEVTRKVAQNPDRIRKFVANLGATPGERQYAIDQLSVAGAAVVPELVSALRGSKDATLKTGIYDAIPALTAVVVPGLLAAIDPMGDLTDDVRLGVLKAVASRKDVAQLVDKSDTDPTPALWYYAATGNPQVKEIAAALLEGLTGGLSRRRTPEQELVRLAEPLVTRKGSYSALDAQSNKVTVWTWDPATGTPKATAVDKAAADEFLALKYLRWAVQVNPKSEAAQLAFLGVATERATERANFGDLKATEPAVYQLLAAAPDATLSALLEQAMAEGRTALAVGVLQAMSDRGQKDESSTGGKASPYVRALTDKDVRVQFAAAVALLRNPTPPGPGASARVVDVLRRALEVKDEGGAVGRAVIVDPLTGRADRLAGQFRDLGYSTEKLVSGRDVLRRVGKASDIDLIVIDRHVADPTLNDVLSQLAADPNAGRRPVLVVASTNAPKAPPLEAQLLRLAVLVAATETPPAIIPPPYVYDPKFPPTQKKRQNLEMAIETARWNRTDERNVALIEAGTARLKRLDRLVEAADLPTTLALSERLKARLPQVTFAVLLAEHNVTGLNPTRPQLATIDPEAAEAEAAAREQAQAALAEAKRTGTPASVTIPSPPPDPYGVFADFTRTIRTQWRLNEAVAKVTDTAKLGQLIEQIEGQLDADTRKRAEALMGKVFPGPLLMDAAEYRDTALEAQLVKQVRGFKGVTVIPEPFGAGGLAEDLKKVNADPAARPQSEAARKGTAKLAAYYLSRIAQGAIAGYTISDAAQADMRNALANDDLAPDLIEGLARLGSGDTQSALVRLAATATRPLPIRTQAADAAARHIQAFGRNTAPAVAGVVPAAVDVEKDPVLRGKLVVLARLVAEKAPDFGGAVSGFNAPLRTPAPPPPPMDPKDPPKAEEKK